MSKNKPRKREQTMRLHLKCPNCLEPMFCFKVEMKIPTFTELTYECRNKSCKGEYVYAAMPLRCTHAPKIIRPGFNVDLSPIAATKQREEALSLLRVADAPQDLDMIVEALPQGDLFYMQSANDELEEPQ